MTVELKPETERLVQEELGSGHIHSVDELIVCGVRALREKHHAHQPTVAAPPRKPRKNLAEAILDVARMHGAHSIRVFGSVARGRRRESSDADFLVEFDKGRTLVDLIGFRLDLRDKLGTEVAQR